MTFKAKLKESGLTPRDAGILGIKPLSAAQTARVQPHYREVPSVFIPYYTTTGKPMGFHRIRYLAPVSSFSQGRKYDGPSGHPPRAYFPKSIRWAKILKDARVPLLITEGEFKAAAASKLGLPTIGIGGVWNWRSKRLGIEFLPELEDFTWTERTVELCFDSDIIVKPEVRAALEALGFQLARRGAKCSVVILPQEGDAKVGLDDYLVAQGTEAFRRLERTPVYVDQEKRRAFLQRYAYLYGNDDVLDLQDGTVFTTRHHFMNARGHERILINGTQKSLVAEWYGSADRLEFPGFLFDPSTPARLIAGKGINLYEGLAVEPRRGSVEPMLKLIDALFGTKGEHKAARDWFLQWLAYPLQHPGAKLSTCVYLWSPEQGIGKTAVGEIMLDIYGRDRHGVTLSEYDFFGGWNEWLKTGLFALCDELSFEGTKKNRSIFKRMITEENAILSEKYSKRGSIQNRCNFYFTSNVSSGLPLETVNRRVLVVRAEKALGLDYMTGTFNDWRNVEQKTGAQSWLHYLLHQVDCSGFKPYADAPVLTSAAEEAVQASATQLESWLREALDSPPFTETDIWASREILALYQMAHPNDHRTGIPAVNTVMGGIRGSRRLRTMIFDRMEKNCWAVRNGEKWHALREAKKLAPIRAEWNKTRP